MEYIILVQSIPLDFGTKEFYHNRKDLIESRISWIREADMEVGVVSVWVWSSIILYRSCPVR